MRIIDIIINVLNSYLFIGFIFLIILGIHITQYFLRDRKLVKRLKRMVEPSSVSINDLDYTPMVNIIIPAWKEGGIFKGCLNSLTYLKYPKLKIIVNAGGNDITIKTAQIFKNYENFIILQQTAGEGKLKAINDCIEYVKEGIVHLIDADVYLDDESLIRMILPIVNQNEKIVVSALKPHESIKSKDIVKFIYINRNNRFRKKLTRYAIKVVGPNTTISYEVIQKVGRFTEGRMHDDGRSIYRDINNLGFKIYHIINHSVVSFNFPHNIKDYIHQNIRWIENNLYYSIQIKHWIRFLKLFFLVLYSLYILIFPFFSFISLNFVFIGAIFLFSSYLKKMRKVIFYKASTKNEEQMNLTLLFYLKIVFYIFIDAYMNIFVFFEFLFFKKRYKQRKNLL